MHKKIKYYLLMQIYLKKTHPIYTMLHIAEHQQKELPNWTKP